MNYEQTNTIDRAREILADLVEHELQESKVSRVIEGLCKAVAELDLEQHRLRGVIEGIRRELYKGEMLYG